MPWRIPGAELQSQGQGRAIGDHGTGLVEIINWWRRRELNPRPRKSAVERLRAFPVRRFSTAALETGKKQRLSPIVFGFRLQAEALDLLLRNDAAGSRAGPWTRGGYLKLGSVCKLRIGSFRFPIVLRELGTRHAFPQRFNPVENRYAPSRLL